VHKYERIGSATHASPCTLVPGLPEAGRRLGSQCRKRIVADRGQLKREGAFLLLSCASLREALVRGNPRETTRLSDVVRARVLVTRALAAQRANTWAATHGLGERERPAGDGARPGGQRQHRKAVELLLESLRVIATL